MLRYRTLFATMKHYDLAMLVCGDRNWSNFYIVHYALTTLIQTILKKDAMSDETAGNVLVIEGEARGADSHAATFAKHHTSLKCVNIDLNPFPADWSVGKSGGPIRNKNMLDHLIASESERKMVIAFHSNIKASKGTLNMLKLAAKNNILYRRFYEDISANGGYNSISNESLPS